MSKHTPNYKSLDEPETAFRKAKQIWNERLGSARKQAFNWRLMAILVTILCFALTSGLVAVAMKSEVEPYIVQVDRATGQVISVEPVTVRYSPAVLEVEYFIKQFVKNIRSVSKDEHVVRTNWLDAYKFVTKSGNQILNTYAREQDPFSMIGKYMITVHIENVNSISKDSFQVEWKEDVYSYQDGKKTLGYSGVFTIKNLKPKTKADIQANPLGIYLDEFSWSQKL